MDFHELTKLPVLITHYMDCEEEGTGTLWGFLRFHYGPDEGKPHDHQDKHDGQLPFQGHHCCQVSHIFIAYGSFLLPSCDIGLIINNFSEYRFIVSSEYLNSIFQPPKA